MNKEMTFKEYQEQALITATYPATLRITYPTLGLNGEAGEVAEKVKKLYRDHDGVIDSVFLENVKLELGDVLWYVSAICRDLGISMEDVARANIEKLHSRRERGVIHGNGDSR